MAVQAAQSLAVGRDELPGEGDTRQEISADAAAAASLNAQLGADDPARQPAALPAHPLTDDEMPSGLQDKPEPEAPEASSSIDSSSTMFRVVRRTTCCQATCFPALEAMPPH